MPFGWFLKMFFKFGLGENARTNKNLDVSHTKREHTHTPPGLLSRVERRNEREREGDEVYKQ
jgi:hypothetical protein